MAITNYRVQGLRELEANLAKLDIDIIQRAGRTACKQAMMPVLARAINNVPVSDDKRTSGDLKKTVKLSAGSTARKGQRDRFAWAAVSAGGRMRSGVKDPGYYALQVHYGTSKDPIQPFLLTAFVGFQQMILANFKRTMENQIKIGTALMGKRAARRLK